MQKADITQEHIASVSHNADEQIKGSVQVNWKRNTLVLRWASKARFPLPETASGNRA